MDLTTILWILLAVAVSIAVLTVGAFLIFRGLLRRRLRLHPKRKSKVPSHWLANPRAPARAHRRLRTATARARLEVASLGPRTRGASDPALLGGALDYLHQRAFELEHVLLSSSRVPRSARPAAMASAWNELHQIEHQVNQVAHAANAWRTTVMRPETIDDQTDMLTYLGRLENVGVRLSEAKELSTTRPATGQQTDGKLRATTGFQIIDLDD